jgi:hypothetical protein
MGLTGNLQALRHLAEQLDELSQVPSRASERIAQDLNPLIQAQFDEGKDPYGNPWAPLAPSTLRKGRSAPPLTDTGRMRATARAMAISATGVAVTIDSPAQFHQEKRPILPVRGEVPETWERVVHNAIDVEIQAIKSGGGRR